jgi:predicted AAA+ superfamily ATPase
VVKTNYQRLVSLPAGSFFLFGIRGVGKSTWARERLPEAHRIDLLDEELYQGLLAEPGGFAAELRALPAGSQVVVDEVQRLPALLNEVHRFMEERQLRFALLGSSARKLKTAGTNLLAGRALWKTMFPFVPEELGQDFDLERALRHGTIPLVWTSPDPGATLDSYVQLYLKEEIKAEALVRNLPGFARFLPIAGLFHGQVLNVSSLARDAGTARTTVDGYLEILEDTLLAFRLPAYEARLRVRERKRPKLYWADPGLARAVKRQRGPVSAEERGPLLEGWVLSLLRAYTTERGLADEIFSWSPAQSRGLEVDFLLQRGSAARGELLAIEVKSSRRVSPNQLKGLQAIAELPNISRRILIYTGDRSLRTEDGVDVLPLDRLHEELEAGSLWP